jgi:hypothetical protein
MRINGDNHTAEFLQETSVVELRGNYRLNGLLEYQPVLDLLTRAINECQGLTIDVRQLVFLNSSGIAMLSKFVLEARKFPDKHLTLRASNDIPWQSKSLKNLQRLLPALELIFD